MPTSASRTRRTARSTRDTVSFVYDDDGLVVQAGPVALDYDVGSGQLATTTVGNVTDDRTRNSFGEVVGYDASFDDGSGPVDLYGLSFERDNLGRIWRKTETVQGQTTVQEYEYDARGRLTDVYEGTDACDVVQCELTQQYDYDANGNRTSLDLGGPVTIGGSYDAQDRLISYGTTTYTYNDRGDLIAKDEGAAGVTNYGYDSFGQLRSVDLPDGTLVEYEYDGVGRRIGRFVDGVRDRRWVYGGGLGPIAELDGSGNIVQRYVYARWPHVPDAIVTPTATYRVVTNQVGSVMAVVDSSTGALVQALSYDVFGEVLSDSAPGWQPFGFAGGMRDELTGLTQFGARWLDSDTGRWTQKDPIGLGGGSTGFYGYVGNDPINRLDPLGFFELDPWGGVVPNAARLAGLNVPTFEDFKKFTSNEANFAFGTASQQWGEGHYVAAGASAYLGALACAAPYALELAALTAAGETGIELAGQAAAKLRLRLLLADTRGGTFTLDQQALVDIAKNAKRTGVTVEEANALRGWANEVGLPFRGPEVHPGRATVNFPHIHVGPIDHIPVLGI